MKHLFKALILSSAIIFIFIFCKKNAEKMGTIEVLAYKTNMTIAGAGVDFHRTENLFLSVIAGIFETYLTKQTDVNGKCTVKEADFVMADSDGISVSKENYWVNGSTGTITRFELSPVGQIAWHIIWINSYPGGSFMNASCN